MTFNLLLAFNRDIIVDLTLFDLQVCEQKAIIIIEELPLSTSKIS